MNYDSTQKWSDTRTKLFQHRLALTALPGNERVVDVKRNTRRWSLRKKMVLLMKHFWEGRCYNSIALDLRRITFTNPSCLELLFHIQDFYNTFTNYFHISMMLFHCSIALVRWARSPNRSRLPFLRLCQGLKLSCQLGWTSSYIMMYFQHVSLYRNGWAFLSCRHPRHRLRILGLLIGVLIFALVIR
jgi:hypothetical protein